MDQINAIIDRVVHGIYKDMPELMDRFGEQGRVKCREDNHHHIKHLNSARNLDSDDFFVDYVLWLNNILTARGMKTEHLIDNFVRLDKEIHDLSCSRKKKITSEHLRKDSQSSKN